MPLQDARVPEPRVQSPVHDRRVTHDEGGVPGRVTVQYDHRDIFARVEAWLPVGEVEDDVECMPAEEASQAGADAIWVGGFDVLVGFFGDCDDGFSLFEGWV